MKEREKKEILNSIKYLSTRITSNDTRIIDIATVEEILNNMPTDKEDVKEVYAIRDLSTGDIIWNARGSAYKEMNDVKKKLDSLDSNKFYKIITYKLEE